MNKRAEEFQLIAPSLDALIIDPAARVFYDLFAGGLVWSDEMPPVERLRQLGVSSSCLRGIWHYRSSLIVGRPSVKHEPSWKLGKQLFPNWPGFDAKRSDPSLADTLMALQTAGMSKWSADTARLDDAATRQPSKSVASSEAIESN